MRFEIVEYLKEASEIIIIKKVSIFIKIPFFIETLINSIIGSTAAFFLVKYLFILINSYFDLSIQIDSYLWIWIIGFSSIIGLYSSNSSMKRNLYE